MKFTVAGIALFVASTLATPLVTRETTTTFTIDDLTIRKKPTGWPYQVSFILKASGTTDVSCSIHAVDGQKIPDEFQSGRLYACADRSPYTWRYEPGNRAKKVKAKISVYFKKSDTESLSGEVEFDEIDTCRAGPQSKDIQPGELICEAQDPVNPKITLKG